MHLTDHPDGEAAIRGAAAASCASRPAATLARPARASAGASRATSTLLDAQRRATACSAPPTTRTRSAACGRRCAAATSGEVLLSAAPGLRVRRLGRRRTTSAAARTGRCTPTTRSARCCGAGPGPDSADARAAVVAARRRADGARALRRARRVRAALLALARPAGARARRGRPGASARRRATTAAARLEARAAPTCCRRSPRGRRSARARRGHAAPTAASYYRSKAKRPLAGLVLRAARGRHGRTKEIAQVLVDDRSGRVLEAWTGYQVAWTMARGYPGAFGRRSRTRCGSGSRCARCSSLPFVARRRCGCCTSTCGAARVLGLLRVLQRRATSASRSRSSIRCSSICWCAC